jgi:hypothetical protein
MKPHEVRYTKTPRFYYLVNKAYNQQVSAGVCPLWSCGMASLQALTGLDLAAGGGELALFKKCPRRSKVRTVAHFVLWCFVVKVLHPPVDEEWCALMNKKTRRGI